MKQQTCGSRRLNIQKGFTVNKASNRCRMLKTHVAYCTDYIRLRYLQFWLRQDSVHRSGSFPRILGIALLKSPLPETFSLINGSFTDYNSLSHNIPFENGSVFKEALHLPERGRIILPSIAATIPGIPARHRKIPNLGTVYSYNDSYAPERLAAFHWKNQVDTSSNSNIAVHHAKKSS